MKIDKANDIAANIYVKNENESDVAAITRLNSKQAFVDGMVRRDMDYELLINYLKNVYPQDEFLQVEINKIEG